MSVADSGKVWFITGTSSGFGKRMVTQALARGDKVIATARNITNLEQALAEHPGSADRLRCLQLDVSSRLETIKKTIEEAIAIWGCIDVVVNNAGIGLPALAAEMGGEQLKEQFEPNVFGVANVNVSVLPYMYERGSGTIVIIGSRSAWKTDVTGIGSYAASKAAVHAYAETLAHEVKSLNIRVLIVEPGAFRTESIYSYPWTRPNYCSALDSIQQKGQAFWNTISGKQPGDPDKAAKAIVDVVRGEGQAAGREMPLWLVLGKDANNNIRDKVAKILQNLDEWKDMVLGTDID